MKHRTIAAALAAALALGLLAACQPQSAGGSAAPTRQDGSAPSGSELHRRPAERPRAAPAAAPPPGAQRSSRPRRPRLAHLILRQEAAVAQREQLLLVRES